MLIEVCYEIIFLPGSALPEPGKCRICGERRPGGQVENRLWFRGGGGGGGDGQHQQVLCRGKGKNTQEENSRLKMESCEYDCEVVCKHCNKFI